MSYNGPERRTPLGRVDRRKPVSAIGRAVREFGDSPTSRWHHVWRDLVPLLALLIALFAVVGVEQKVDQAAVEATVAKRAAESQREGRGVAVGIICGALRGVEDAGRLVLTDRLPGTEQYRRPSTAQERTVQRAYATAYNRVITERIIAEAGATGERVIEPDGTVNCTELRVASGTPP